MQTKDLEIPKEMMEETWQTTKVKIRKWNLNIRNQIIDEVAEFSQSRGSPVSTKIQGGHSQILIIAKCILEAPWKVGDVNIVGDFDPDIGDWLYSEISAFNEGGLKNSEGLEESSKEK